MPEDPPTEPLDDIVGRHDTAPATSPAPPPASEPDRVFASTRYRFETGVHAGETAHVRNGDNQVVLTYRGFATVVNVVAALVAAIVMVAGIAAALFLLNEHRALAAAAAIVLSLVFSFVIAALVPDTRVTLLDGTTPVLHIVQMSRGSFPATKYAVQSADGRTIGVLRRSMISRLARNSWSIDTPPDQRGAGFAVEESFWRALVRKVAGKFSRAHEANVRIYDHGIASGLVVRRPDATGETDYLDLTANGSLDRRVAVALATLIFGSEP